MKGEERIMSVFRNAIRFCFPCILLLFSIMGCGQSPDKLYSEGKSMIMAEDTFEQGFKKLQKFIEKFPDDPRMPEVMLAVASAWQSKGSFDEAASAYNELISSHPKSNEACKAMFLLGYMYYDSLNDKEKAQKTLSQFIKTYPDSELTVSAKVLIDNLGVPVENWSIVRELEKSASE